MRGGDGGGRRAALWVIAVWMAWCSGIASGAAAAQSLDARVRRLGERDPIGREIARRELFAARAVAPLEAGAAASDPSLIAAALELLSKIAPERAAAAASTRVNHPHPAVRVAGATALARASGAARETVAIVLADPDVNVVAAWLDASAERTVPVRRRLARELAPELLALLDQGDPGLRSASLELLTLDDSPTTASALLARLPTLAAREQRLLLERVAATEPLWPAELLREFARTAAPERASDETSARMLALRLAARFDRDGCAPFLDDELRALLLCAGGPPNRTQEDAAAALAALGPSIVPRLAPLLPQLESEESFEGAIELFLRLRGCAGLDDLIAQLLRARDDPQRALPLLGIFARLPCEAIARKLEESVAPKLDPALRSALVEAAQRMPPCEPQRRLLLDALRDLHGEARLRPFEVLARSGESALLGFLLDALDAERNSRVRGRMIEQIAESFGASDPDDVLVMIDARWKSGDPKDRAAALEGVPFVALRDRAEAVAERAVALVAKSAPDVLLHVLSQIGGATAEQCFERIAAETGGDVQQEELYRFLLSRAGRLGGPRMQKVLRAALDDTHSERVHASALRALIESGDAAAIECAPRVLAGLPPELRIPLLSDLAPLRHLDGYPAFIETLLLEAEDLPARLALLELAEPSLRERLAPIALARLQSALDPEERFGLIEALGKLGGEAALAALEERIASALALPVAQFLESSPLVAEGRVALLALAAAAPKEATPRLACMLLRLEAARAPERVARAALALPAAAALADPALVGTLSLRPAAESCAALRGAWDALGELASLCDERFFSDCAEIAARAGGPSELADWFDERVLELWPPDSANDFRALLPSGPRRELLRRASLHAVDDELLADVPRVVAALAHTTLSPRERFDALGRSDGLLGLAPTRTLATLAALGGDGCCGASASDRLATAIRETAGSPLLASELAAWARARGLTPPPGLLDLATTPRPDDAELGTLRATLEAAGR